MYFVSSWNPNFDLKIHLGVAECHILLLGNFDPDLLPRFRKLVKRKCPVFSNYFNQMSCVHSLWAFVMKQ